MKRLLATALVATALVSTSIACAPTAHAQIPVTDLASLFKQISIHIARAAEWYKQYQRWQEQFRRWQKQYDAITGNWDRLVSGNLDPALLQAMRDTFPGELQELMDQRTGIFGDLQADYQRLRQDISTLPADYYPAASELAVRLEKTLDTVAMQQATADTTYRATRENLSAAEQLRRDVQTADSLKRSSDINARINAEMLAVAAEANRLSIIRTRKQANDERRSQQTSEEYSQAFSRRTPPVDYGAPNPVTQ
jgi:type IV secretion system protein VirB5